MRLEIKLHYHAKTFALTASYIPLSGIAFLLKANFLKVLLKFGVKFKAIHLEETIEGIKASGIAEEEQRQVS